MSASDDERNSQGSENLSDTVENRPELPRDTDPLGARAESDVSSALDAESLFSETNLFRGLSTEEVREIVRVSETRTIAGGETLFEQGDEAKALYMIQAGEFEVRASSPYSDEVVLAHLGPGAVIGEMALLEGGTRSATLEALSECTFIELSNEAFNALREKKRHAAYKLILNLAAVLGERRRQADARVFEVFDNPAEHIDVFESQLHDMLARMRKA
jgi:CRP-like cAMP-binding protein